jgi:hypothetical protein
MKGKSLLMLSLLAAGAMTSCTHYDDDEINNGNGTGNGEVVKTDASFYVVNAGNYYSGIDGTLDYVTVDGDSYTQKSGVFKIATGQSLGNTPQDAVIYGDKMYIAVYASNRVFVVNKNTLALEATIETNEPRDIVAYKGNVYVDNYDGHVSRIDTLTLSVDKTIEVGPNPEEMAIANGYLYVTNSDGMNYANNYADGKSVSKVNLSTFEEVKKIAVGLNPTKAVATENGYVFIVAMGDYYLTPATVQQIDVADNVCDVCAGTNLAANGTNLYVLNAPYGASEITYTKYDVQPTAIETASVEEVAKATLEDIVSASSFAINPVNKDLYVGSYSLSEYGYADYYSNGYINVYDETTGAKKTQIPAGVGPCALIFR